MSTARHLGWLPNSRGQAAAERVDRLLRPGGEERQPRELTEKRSVLSILQDKCCISLAFNVAHGSPAEHVSMR